MSWSNFTNQYIKTFKQNKYSLKNDNILIQEIKKERSNIKLFISQFIDQPIDLKIELLNEKQTNIIDKKINKFSNVKWVDYEGIKNELSSNILDKIYKITWLSSPINQKQNQMIIKTGYLINKILLRIKLIIYIIEYLKKKSNNENKIIDMYLILSSLKKTFPIDNDIMSVKNANTGYTDFNENIIFVWRLEEFDKVIFHEVIHYLKMDCSEHYLDHIINTHGPHSYFEAITDFWGIFYHLIYLSIITNSSIKSLLELELSFIKNQAMRVNKYFKLKDWNKKPTNLIKQDTPAFSYYILKYLIFEYLLNNNLDEIYDYNNFLIKITNIGFKQEPCIDLESSRMTLLQLG